MKELLLLVRELSLYKTWCINWHNHLAVRLLFWYSIFKTLDKISHLQLHTFHGHTSKPESSLTFGAEKGWDRLSFVWNASLIRMNSLISFNQWTEYVACRSILKDELIIRIVWNIILKSHWTCQAEWNMSCWQKLLATPSNQTAQDFDFDKIQIEDLDGTA